MKDLKIGVHIAARTVSGLIEGIVAAERAGVDTAWLTTGGLAPDPLAVFAAAAGLTERIKLGTSIVPTYPRHPLALAQSALVVDELAPGRLRLGVGTSTKRVIEGTYGIPFRRPQQELREYATILKSILGEAKVSHRGEVLSADGAIAAAVRVSVLTAALHPQAFRLAGEVADGAITWACPLSYVKEQALPALREGAISAGRTRPTLIAHLAVAVETDLVSVREAFRRQLAIYPRVPVYASMFQGAGFPEASAGRWSDPMIDSLLVSGDAQVVASKLRALAGQGIDEILVTVLQAGAAPAETASRTLATLGELNRTN